MQFKECSKCKFSTFLYPGLKLLVNMCLHPLCLKCINQYQSRGKISCPTCSKILDSNDFHERRFNDLLVDRDMFIRSRIMYYYNLKEEDFSTLTKYNDYLEEIETIIYNLCNNKDVIETNKRIEAYKRKNHSKIMLNRYRKSRANIELDEMIRMDLEDKENKRQAIIDHHAIQKEVKSQYHRELIVQLMSSHKNAKMIYNEYAKKAAILHAKKTINLPKKALNTPFSSGVQIRSSCDYLPLPDYIDEQCFEYQAPTSFVEGPIPPTLKDVVNKGYLRSYSSRHIRQHAGGLRPEVPYQRILEATYNGLYHNCNSI